MCVWNMFIAFYRPWSLLSKWHLLELNLVFNHLLGHIHVHNELYKKKLYQITIFFLYEYMRWKGSSKDKEHTVPKNRKVTKYLAKTLCKNKFFIEFTIVLRFGSVLFDESVHINDSEMRTTIDDL